MSRPEMNYDIDPLLGDREQRQRHQMSSSLFSNSLHYLPPTTQWTLDRREKSALMSPAYAFQGSQAMKDHYGVGSQADNASPSIPSINTASYSPQLASSVSNLSMHPLSVSAPSLSKLSNSGYSFSPPDTSINPYMPPNDREAHLNRRTVLPIQTHAELPFAGPNHFVIANEHRYTLWWGELEPWMDEEYAKQVCKIMNWDPASIKVPRPPPDPATGQQLNNPGYCFLSFTSHAQATAVINQTKNSVIMPNSSKPFVLNWAPAVPFSPSPSPTGPTPVVLQPHTPSPAQLQQQSQQQQQQQFSKEYSIFVGDLAPEVSNSDLVAVFRNPVLGLRNDREPRFIRPFSSCKSAKIMLDPVTGVSRGYGFVRFTEETDQQRALIEMHGLYCLSRPMRISPATAKYKVPASTTSSSELEASLPLDTVDNSLPTFDQALLSNKHVQTHSVSASLASSQVAVSNLVKSTPSPSVSSLNSGPVNALKASSPSEDKPSSQSGLGSNSGIGKPGQQIQDQALSSQRYIISEESWKHHAQARAILSNLIGPNGEQLSSSDPYNTTVFVGGLSPLISEDTLRTFFAPFGEIHYVKVPAGKNCGFVQFIRKPDAERAIQKMQGFPIGGSRIRLSWGRSQYKAAQAAAQAAQTAALQAQAQHSQVIHGLGSEQRTQMYHSNAPSQSQSPQPAANVSTISPEQALELVQKLGLTRFIASPETPSPLSSKAVPGLQGMDVHGEHSVHSTLDPPNYIDSQIMRAQSFQNFSPFATDTKVFSDPTQKREASLPAGLFTYQPENYGSAFEDVQKGPNKSDKASPEGTSKAVLERRPSSASTQRFGAFSEGSTPHAGSRQDPRGPKRRLSFSRKTQLDHEGSADVEKHGPFQDLNGTLASLDLDSRRESWRLSHTPSTPTQ